MLNIVGTSHHYQFGAGTSFGDDYCTEENQSAFVDMLRILAVTLEAKILAEELNQQALEEVGKNTSVLQLVAKGLAIQHMFCDPDRGERVKLGIKSENEIRITAFPKRLSEAVVKKLEAESIKRREQEWLRRLVEAKSKNILFICGANHISTFVQLALGAGFKCRVAHANWIA